MMIEEALNWVLKFLPKLNMSAVTRNYDGLN
jgi:hypothetical protein